MPGKELFKFARTTIGITAIGTTPPGPPATGTTTITISKLKISLDHGNDQVQGFRMNIDGNQFPGHRAAPFTGRSACVGADAPARSGKVHPSVLPGLVLVPALGVQGADEPVVAADAPMEPMFRRQCSFRRAKKILVSR